MERQPVVSELKKFAAFDIDGTIARNSLFFEVVRELVEQEKLPKDTKQKLDQKYMAYQQRAHPQAFEEFSRLSVEVLQDNLTGLQVENYREAVDRVIKRVAAHVYVYTRDMIKRLHQENYFLIALSGSEMYAVEKFTKQFSFNLAIGETYHEKDGFFTGEIEQVIHRKDRFIKKFVQEHELSFEDSIAIGDSMGDVGMLELVEHPIAFNPEERLYHLARERGWKIVVERKNVAYELVSDGAKHILR